MSKNKSNESYYFTNDPSDYSGQNSKHIVNKFDHDLYNEESNIVNTLVRVKRIGSGATEKWKIMVDNKLAFTLEGSKVSKKEKEFLRTLDGINFLIAQAKQGIKSFNKLRVAIKEKLNE